MANQASYVGPVFADNTTEYALQQRQLAERKRLAQELVNQGMTGNGGAGMAGNVYMVGNQWGNLAKSLGGSLMGAMADRDQQNLQVSQNAAQQDFNEAYRNAPDDATRQNLLIGAQGKGLRTDLHQAFLKSEQDRIERGEQLAADREARAAEAEANRIDRGEQAAADRVAREDLRRIPAQSVHVSVGGGAQGGFAGAAPVIGADENQNPIYRHTKSGQLFQFDENGQPTPYAGKVGAKPASDKPLTEGQGNAVLYGARAGEAHKVLDTVGNNYNQMRIDMARGAENMPVVGNMANFSLGENEQKVYQAQRDFINAVMRRESGATILPSEFDNARKQYFPQQGDKPSVLAQKKANRELVIKGLAEVSGPTGKKAIENITTLNGSVDNDPLGIRGKK